MTAIVNIPAAAPAWTPMGDPSGNAAKLAEQEGVDIRKYSIIYDAIEEVKSAMEGSLIYLLNIFLNK